MPFGLGCNEGLGLCPKRAAFERFAQACPMGRYSIDRDKRPGKQDGYWSSHTQIMWDAWCAAWDCQQASIDRLMLEWCPDEMTPRQMAEWAKAQVNTPGFDEAALDAAVAAERERWIVKAGAAYADAHEIFNNPPSETSQDVRDVIEWHLYAMRHSEIGT